MWPTNFGKKNQFWQERISELIMGDPQCCFGSVFQWAFEEWNGAAALKKEMIGAPRIRFPDLSRWGVVCERGGGV